AGVAALRPRARGDAMRAVALGGRAAGAAPVRGGIARGRTGPCRQAPERPPGTLYAAPAAHQRRLPYRTHLYRLGPATRGRSAARGGYRALVRQAAAGPADRGVYAGHGWRGREPGQSRGRSAHRPRSPAVPEIGRASWRGRV